MITREPVNSEQRRLERKAVGIFFLMNVVSSHENTPVRELYEAYVEWVERSSSIRSQVSIDGFGRLIPKNYKRKAWRVDGTTARVVVGVSLL